MRKALFGLGLFLIAACGGSSEKDDSESGAPAPSGGENESGGGSVQDRGGTTSAGGDAATAGDGTGATATGGNASGGSPRGGATQGGSTSSGGAGGSGADAAGKGGSSDGTSGSSTTGGISASGSGGRAGASGTGGSSGVAPTCDPQPDELDNTPYPDCRARDASDRCELCIEANCCEEARVCYGYDPGNVCGWGGPTTGAYAGLNEIDCFVACVRDYVEENGAYDDAADDRCIPRCTTERCGLIGMATQELVACLRANCDDDCFVP